MCLTVYIASDAALALVPYLDADPRFNVRPLEQYDMAARTTIAANNVVSAGAHTGCGCGFMPDEDEPAEVIASRTALQHYLKEALERGPIDLFVCWNGDVSRPDQS